MKEPTPGQQVEQLLLHYQQMAMRTLGGPASHWNQLKGLPEGLNINRLPVPQIPAAFQNFQKKAQTHLPYDFSFNVPFPAPTVAPILLSHDTGSIENNKVTFTELEGQNVPSFNIGGEERICLPTVLTSILNGIDLDVTNQACDRLQIYLPKCSQMQLQLLKQLSIIPPHVFCAGLIRKSDAERLCTQLLHSTPSSIIDIDERKYPTLNETCFPVYHECFGEGHGFFYTSLYTEPSSKCISCADCERLFSPDRFITHSHYNQESKVCHWGFDRKNWRSYLLLSEDEIEDDVMEKMMKAFEKTLDKFKQNERRRKMIDETTAAPDTTSQQRRATDGGVDVTTLNGIQHNPTPVKRRCQRAPMRASCYDDSGKPVLEDPERAVSHSETHLYEKHFVPNVSLKPAFIETQQAGNLSVWKSDTPTDEQNNVLDLSSPKAKSSSPLADGSHEKADAELEAGDDEEEILDVTSDGSEHELDCNPMTVVDNSESNSCQVYLDAMVKLFHSVLAKSSMSEQAQIQLKEEYVNLCEKVKSALK